MSMLKYCTIFIVLALLIGCSGGGAKTTESISVKPVEPVIEEEATKPATLDLAAQAQQQVDQAEQFLASRKQGKANPAHNPGEANGPPATPPIKWNFNSSSQTAPQDQPVVEVKAEPTSGQGSIFSDAPPPIIVTDPPASEVDKTQAALTQDRLQQCLIEAAAEIRRTAADSDTPLPYLLSLAAMVMVDPDRTLEPEMLYDLSEEERAWFESFQQFFQEMGAGLKSQEEAEQIMLEAVTMLREKLTGSLAIPTAALCYRVDGFGIYDPFPKSSFLADSEQQVIVYLEIDDFTSELNPQGKWKTELSQLLTIYSDDGLIVWGGRDWEMAVDVSQQKRTDFFTIQVVTFPDALGVGIYTLKIRIRDEHSGAEAETALPFELVADPALATRVP